MACVAYASPASAVSTYALVGTQQDRCYDNAGPIDCPAAGKPFHGQDAERPGPAASYHDNRDGTVLDTVTGLIWTQGVGEKVTWEEARSHAAALRIGGFDDWRLPTVKELYSLIDFRGRCDPDPARAVPYIDRRYFEFKYGDPAKGERMIDAQEWSSSAYAGRTMGHDASVFGVNFADGRIKAYPLYDPRSGGTAPNRLYARYVRGPAYGVNRFEEGVGGVVEDHATHLVWQRADDGKARTWQEALRYCEGLFLSGRADWHLPNAKELQSIVDYDSGSVPAIHAFFTVMDPKGYFWTSTTHLEGPPPGGSMAVTIAFGRAMGYMPDPATGELKLIDVHGAGAQRSDPKSGDPENYPHGLGPQGDDVRIRNYARCVTKE